MVGPVRPPCEYLQRQLHFVGDGRQVLQRRGPTAIHPRGAGSDEGAAALARGSRRETHVRCSLISRLVGASCVRCQGIPVRAYRKMTAVMVERFALPRVDRTGLRNGFGPSGIYPRQQLVEHQAGSRLRVLWD